MNSIKLNNILIGDGNPCVVIPEGCSNHMGSLDKAKEMAYKAKEAGAEIIKWQMHLPEEEMVKEEAIKASKKSPVKWGSIWDFYKKFALSVEDHYKLKEYCNQIGIQYFCTPFSLKAAQILNDMGVYGFKIGSGETEDLLMLEEITKFKKPLIVSTGMSDFFDIDATANVLKDNGTPFALAHCVSIYKDQKISQLNYGLISELKNRYQVPVGLSDHTPPENQEPRIWGAVCHGANFIEKHFTLDKKQNDADSWFSLEPDDLKNLIKIVKEAEEASGTEKKVFEEEKLVEEWAKRSIISAVDIKEGSIITRETLISKRPGTGIRSRDYKQIIGKKTKVFIPKNTLIKWENIEK